MPDTPIPPTDASAAVTRREHAARSTKAGLVLVALLLAVYLPGLFSIPVVDRDEARFAQASRQMFESLAWSGDQADTRPFERTESGQIRAGHHAGGWSVPMVGERPRLAKPPLIYWLQSASAAVLTGLNPLADHIWHYRLPSVLSAIAACLITWRLGVAMGCARAGWLGALLLGVCPMVVWDANQARADQLLLATTTGAMAALMLIHRAGASRGPWSSWGLPAGFWLSVGAGVLTKGPITPMVAVLTALVVSWVGRDWRWLRRTRPLLGLVILAAVLAPWVVATARTVGWDTLTAIWFDETIGRSAEPKEGHWGPPGYHFVLLALLFWPGSLLTLYALGLAVRGAVRLPEGPTRRARWRARGVGDPAMLFLMAWIVPSWLIFEIVGTKLPHYTLPLYPPIALLTARAVLDLADRILTPPKPVPPVSGLAIWVVLGVALTAGAPVAIAVIAGEAFPIVAAVVGGLVSVGLIVVAARAVRRSLPRAHALAVGAALVFVFTLLQLVLPNARALHVTEQLAAIIDRAPSDAPVGAAVYHEDSLTFATRARVRRLGPMQVADWADANPGAVLILPADAPAQPGWTELGRAEGINYSKGERVELRVFRVE
ncbi:MAG: glycosyltransferase family 39 protein [Phycisphaerales bacterium]|nr:glycosyltransferase family 39 protein [Planctomycetota bacterium]MCH8508831.1 glycosyltransferase family 39 protein [Phycisphaerales bacterium]